MLTRLGLVVILAAPILVVAYCLGCFDFLHRVAPREGVAEPAAAAPPAAQATPASEPEILPCSLTVPAAAEGPELGTPATPDPLSSDPPDKLMLQPLEQLPLLTPVGAETSARKPSPETASSAGTGTGDPLALPDVLSASPLVVPASAVGTAREPIVVPGCRLTVMEKQEVACQRDGILAVIGTEVQEGEEVPPERLITVQAENETKRYRRLKEDDPVTAGQLLARLDDRLARDELAIKHDRVLAAEADLVGAEKSRDEARERYLRQMQLRAAGEATSEEEIANARLTWTKAYYEAVNKKKAVDLARLELNQARTVLEMHEIRSTISGVLKAIYKNPGEAVKTFEPVFQVRNLSRLRAEGMLDAQFLPGLHKGMPAAVEVAQDSSPLQVLIGHRQEVTGVAVTADAKSPAIVSAGEDGTVRVWDRRTGRERRILQHPAAIRALATAPAGPSYCLAGGADGNAWLWDLDSSADRSLHVLKGAHRGPVTCVAFSPDGKACATGGEDHDICLWDTATGQLRYRLPAGHLAAVTSLQFTPQQRLVSAGRDNTLRIWRLEEQGARLENSLEHRSGDVTALGVSPDGGRVLFDQGKSLRLLSLPDGLIQGALQGTAGATDFTTFGLFSPDARLVLTAGDAGSRLQLWRAPAGQVRACELRRLLPVERTANTCAAFAPDGSFVVTGTRDRQVLVWPVPAREDVDRQLTAAVSLIEPAVESNGHQVRIWAELANPGGLLPGAAVTMILYPGE